MNRRSRTISLLSFPILFSLFGCSIYIHDEDAAARVAQTFAEQAFVRDDVSAAYPLLDESLKAQFSSDRLREGIARMHPDGRPISVTADDFEPLPGKDIVIYLRGFRQNGQINYYRIVLRGTGDKKYLVLGFFRSPKPYPASTARQPLKNHTAK